jgi:hypothetical protein
MRPILRLSVAALLATSAATARADPIELVSSDAQGVTLRLTVSGETLAPESDPRAAVQTGRQVLTARGLAIAHVAGRPMLPYASTLVGLPPGATARVRVLNEASELVRDRIALAIAAKPGFRSEPGALGQVPIRTVVEPIRDGSWPRVDAEVGTPFVLRRQRLVSVSLYPYRYDAASDRLWSRTTMTVRVDFVGGSAASGGPSSDRHWDAVLRSGVINFDQSGGWRVPPARRETPLFRPGLGRSGAQTLGFDESGPEVRVKLDSSAVYQLDYDALATNGYPSGTPVGQVSVHRHEFLEGTAPPDPCYATIEMPCEVDDRNKNGVFDSGDRIYLPVQTWALRSGATTPQRAWGDGEVVFVTVKAAGGLRLGARDGWRGASGLTPLASGPVTLHLERDWDYFPVPVDTLQDPFHWVAITLYYSRADTFPIPLNHLDTSRPISVKVDMEGRADEPHLTSIAVHPAGGPLTMIADSVAWYGRVSHQFTATFPGTSLGEGSGNRLTLWGHYGGIPPDPTNNAVDHSALDWYEVTFWRGFHALNRYLDCSSGDAAGIYQIHADSFIVAAKDTMRVYDLTDPLDPVRLLVDPSHFQVNPNTLGGFVDFQDSTATARHYVVFSRAKTVPVGNYSFVARRQLYANAAGDYLLIVPEAFLPAVGPLVNLRSQQGLRVMVAPLESVNDEFNGGRHSAYSIERLVRRSFDSFDTRFVLLVGDGSQDPLNHVGSARPDWIPVRQVLGPVFATGGYEAVPSDPWYVIFGNQDVGQSAPILPDLFIGRLPVNSLQDAQDVIAKLVSYESVDSSQTWRGRILLNADDSYSGDSFFGGGGPQVTGYCHEGGEDAFHELSDAVATIITSPDSAGLSQTALTKFYLSQYLRNAPSDGSCPSCEIQPSGWTYPGANGDTCRLDRPSVQTLTNGSITPKLLGLLDQGTLWWNFQGHANSSVLTHEDLLRNQPGDADAFLLTNDNRPFLFSAFSCHANAFAYYNEASRGASIGENLLVQPSRGAIGAWASTGYEILPISSTDHINTEWARAMFFRPPQDEYLGDRGSRVVLGETIALALMRYVPRPNIQFFERGIALTYNLLGDPATRLSIGKPQSVVTANALPVVDLTPIRLHTVGDTLRLEADLVSNVRLDRIQLEHQAATTDTVPATSYTLTPSFPDTAAGSSGGRRYHLLYETQLEPRATVYRFRTTDRYGITATFTAAFEFFTQLRANGVPLADGDPVPPTAAMTMLVRSPKPLTPATDLTLTVNGTATPFTFQPSPGDASGREWILAWDHAPYGVDLYTVVLGVNGGVPQEHTFRVTTGGNDLQLLNVFNFPNPFQEERGTAFSFFLAAGGPVDVMIRVFTVSGKLIYERVERGLAPGYHQLPWDGRDNEGDQIANGVYLYKVVATNGTKSQTYLGRLVKLRNPHHADETATTP